jgi:hypothetical protein
MVHVINHGDILHCRSKRLIGRIIMKLTKSKWSHTALAMHLNGNLFVVDAQKDGVNLRPFEAWHEKFQYDIEVSRPYSAFLHWNWDDRAFSKVGVTSYDFVSLLIRFPWMLLTGRWRNRGTKEDDRMVCSEFVSWCYDHPEWYKMTPQAVYEWCQNPKFETIIKIV